MSACKDGIYAAYLSLTMSEKRLGLRWNAVARESSEENTLYVATLRRDTTVPKTITAPP